MCGRLATIESFVLSWFCLTTPYAMRLASFMSDLWYVLYCASFSWFFDRLFVAVISFASIVKVYVIVVLRSKVDVLTDHSFNSIMSALKV